MERFNNTISQPILPKIQPSLTKKPSLLLLNPFRIILYPHFSSKNTVYQYQITGKIPNISPIIQNYNIIM
ncbi:hypothetical protein NBO_34g0027 [Nosema bombycis CQ1]|uniref:Uncharacterized protein n=1 Tax=Nosema bombycis (strain CQ1 / CVCC 102059) TaxID=578461 RepID=R0KVD0_NOSB1|nr:hypothetical protein NBO_34g0027 [Nosema bombycis CQ1]|eukprot:EOB14177.1 hypothetical protein NBO_34g0027 [Nosema bombycis CQ1]